jgi:predicted TIM-barrel fold metal-dependent hydrolase
MRIVDCHVHVMGEVDTKALLKQMDSSGIARMLIVSDTERVSLGKTRQNLLATKRIFDAAPDRLSGLAWVNPTIPGMAGLAEEALGDLGFAGLTIIPDHWYAYDERLEPFWERMNALKARILFHTGILYLYDDGSRFCRPLWLEKLVHYPNIRFAMAHISWPWCEECLAVMGRFGAAAGENKTPRQCYIDLTPGTPRHVRKQAVANAIDFAGADRILWGSDSVVPSDLSYQKQILKADLKLFDELGLTAKQKQRILAGTAEELFPPKR